MSANPFTIASAQIDTGTAEKTILQIQAAANHGCWIKRIDVSFDGISPTSAPIHVKIARQSEAGTGGVTVTPRQTDRDIADAIQATALSGPVSAVWTSDPTTGDILYEQFIHPQGSRPFIFPYGQWLAVHGNDRIGVIVTAGVDVDCLVTMECEE